MDFKVGKIQAHTVQTADVIHNHGAPGLSDELDRLRSLAEVEGSPPLQAAIAEATEELASSTPHTGRLAAVLERVKVLAAGMASAAAITGSVERIVDAVNGLP